MHRYRKGRPQFLFLKIFLLLAALIGGSVAFIVNFCQTKEIKVRGNVISDADEVQQAVLTDPYDINAVYATIRNRFSKQVKIPFVESYRVSMKNLNTLVISVREKELTGYLMNEKGDKYVYYGPDGKVQEVSDRRIKGTFFVEGIVVPDAEPDEPVNIDPSDSKTILTLQKELERENLKVKKIHFSPEGVITFRIKGVEVNLGTRTAVAEKIRRLRYILPKLKGMKGTLHLEEWSEENTDIVFEKAG